MPVLFFFRLVLNLTPSLCRRPEWKSMWAGLLFDLTYQPLIRIDKIVDCLWTKRVCISALLHGEAVQLSC